MMRGTYDDVEGALRNQKRKKIKIYASDVKCLTRTKRKRFDARCGENLGVSIMEVPEFPDGQLFDGRRLWLRRYPEARHGSHLSGPYGGRGATERICGLHVCRNVGVVQ
jgi:hypothetical protein